MEESEKFLSAYHIILYLLILIISIYVLLITTSTPTKENVDIKLLRKWEKMKKQRILPSKEKKLMECLKEKSQAESAQSCNLSSILSYISST